MYNSVGQIPFKINNKSIILIHGLGPNCKENWKWRTILSTYLKGRHSKDCVSYKQDTNSFYVGHEWIILIRTVNFESVTLTKQKRRLELYRSQRILKNHRYLFISDDWEMNKITYSETGCIYKGLRFESRVKVGR